MKWKSNENNATNLLLSSTLPYLYNTPLTPVINFKIHKQDSSFLNNSINSEIYYKINNKTEIGLQYDYNNSQNTSNTTDINLKDYKTSYIGIGFNYLTKNFSSHASFLYGSRKSITETEPQFKIYSKNSYLQKITTKSSFLLKNETGLLFSNTLLTNESFRIGGIESIRGFDEESVFTHKYTLFNLQYNYDLFKNSQIFPLVDLALTSNNSKALNSYGIGFSTKKKSNKIDILGIITPTEKNTITLNKIKFIFNISTFF